MEKMRMKPKSLNNSANSPNNLSLHKDSHVVSKLRPKIRIIHLFAPEVIKTDAANFRQLVQSLTGKDAAADPKGKDEGSHDDKNRRGFDRSADQLTAKKTAEQKGHDDQFPAVIKEEVEELWRSGDDDHDDHKMNSSTTSFLDGFSDLEYGFIDEISEFRTSLPLRSSSRIDHVIHEDPKL